MTANDLRDWKQHPVTQAVFKALNEREQAVKETLATSAGQDSKQDLELVGYIKALRDVYLIDAEDVGDIV